MEETKRPQMLQTKLQVPQKVVQEKHHLEQQTLHQNQRVAEQEKAVHLAEVRLNNGFSI